MWSPDKAEGKVSEYEENYFRDEEIQDLCQQLWMVNLWPSIYDFHVQCNHTPDFPLLSVRDAFNSNDQFKN